jgi:hypothetical protein
LCSGPTRVVTPWLTRARTVDLHASNLAASSFNYISDSSLASPSSSSSSLLLFFFVLVLLLLLLLCFLALATGQAPFTFQAGVGKVIRGWDKGCLGMMLGSGAR